MSKAIKATKVLLTAIIASFLIRSIIQNLDKINLKEMTLNWTYLILATAPFIAHLFIYSALWRIILKIVKADLPIKDANLIYSVSNLGRYVPGRVTLFITRVAMCGEKGIPKHRSVLSIILEQGLALAGAALIFSVSLLFLEDTTLNLAGIAGLVLLLIPVFPELLLIITRMGFKLLKIKEKGVELGYKNFIWLLIAYSLTWVIQGIGFYLIISGLGETSLALLPVSIGIFAITAVITFIAAITPGGVGVREGLIILLLSPYVTPTVAAASAIISRLELVLAELLFAAISKLAKNQ